MTFAIDSQGAPHLLSPHRAKTWLGGSKATFKSP